MIKRKLLMTLIAIGMALMMVPSVQASIGLPDYDSGWVSINQNEIKTFTHNLGTEELLVYVIGKSGPWGISQAHIGGEQDTWDSTTRHWGLYWALLNSTSITVQRNINDYFFEQVRVRIWKIVLGGGAVGGIAVPVDKFGLLAPYIGLASAIMVATAASAIYVKRRKKK